MPKRPLRPALQDRYDRRRELVVIEAARLFAEHGYDQTSMQQLADHVGVAAGGLYHYFGGKQQLLMAICDQLMEPLWGDAQAIVDADKPAEERLRDLVRLWVSHVVEHRHHVLVFQQERHVIERGEEWRGVRASRKRFERLVEALLDEMGPRLADKRLALAALLGMVNHTAQWFRPRGHLTAESIADAYTDLLVGSSHPA